MGSHRFEVITKNNLSSLGFLRSRNGFFRLCPAFARVSFDYHVCRLQSHDCIKVVAGSGVRQWFSLRQKTFQVDAMDEGYIIGRFYGGEIPIGVVASLRKIKKLTRDASLIVSALRESSLLVVSPNEKKVKRLQPLPSTEIKDPMLCTVLVENLPHDHSLENLQRVFGEAGNIKNITVRDPHAARESKKATTAEKLLVGKLHALVEYDTVEAAEKAVGMLNNEQDWRYGLRVKLLKKKTKAELSRQVWREVDAEKNNTVQATNPAVEEENHYSSDHRDESHDEEGEELLTKDKTGEHSHKEKNAENSQKENNVQRNRHRGRGRRQKYHGTNGHGHGTAPSGHVVEPSKPPPGPKMPDGTRGFSMGRGRPLVSDAS